MDIWSVSVMASCQSWLGSTKIRKMFRNCKFGTQGKNFPFYCGPYKCIEIAEGKCKSNNSTKSSNFTKSPDIKNKNFQVKELIFFKDH